jgi:hypothetical protein
MKRTILWALGALNLVLLAALLAPYVRQNEAMAQRAGGGRRPELMMIPGEVVGGNSAVVYLVDTANRRLGAISLNNKGNGLDAMSPQDLDRVFSDRGAAPADEPRKR